MSELLQVRRVSKRFPVREGLLQRVAADVLAVDRVDLTVRRGECLALVGESGSGKTTLGRCMVRLIEPTAGEIFFEGKDLRALSPGELRRERRHFQMIFQDPGSSMNPRLTLARLLGEPLEIHTSLDKGQRSERVGALLEMVELSASLADRLPHELSAGQRQRIAIARALATQPRFLVADEPISALDLSVRSQILDLMIRLRRDLGLSMLIIAHDLSVVRQIADRVAVMYCGRIVELADTERLFADPQHPYSVSLLSAIPSAEPDPSKVRYALHGEPPDPARPPSGCRFHPRCAVGKEHCREDTPRLQEVNPEYQVACHYPGEMKLEPRLKPKTGTF